MNYVELIVATLSGLPEGERKKVLEEVAKEFGLVVGHDVKAQEVDEAKAKIATVAALAKGHEQEFMEKLMAMAEASAVRGRSGSVLQKPSDLLKGRK